MDRGLSSIVSKNLMYIVKLFKLVFESDSPEVYEKFRSLWRLVIKYVSVENPPVEFCVSGFFWKLREEIETNIDAGKLLENQPKVVLFCLQLIEDVSSVHPIWIQVRVCVYISNARDRNSTPFQLIH